MPASAGAASAELDARHDLERDAGGDQRQRLFPAAAEHERVAALQPHDALAAARGANHQLVDHVWRMAGRPARLPTKKRCALPGEREDVGVDQRVVENHVGGSQAGSGSRVSRSGSPGPAPTSATEPGAEVVDRCHRHRAPVATRSR